MRIRSSPSSYTVMFLPTSPRPPSGMMRRGSLIHAVYVGASTGALGSLGGMTISLEELRLATRNHGMPLEALRWPITPVGLHYLLVHYDIPAVDPAGWRLLIGGRVRRELSMSLQDLRDRPAARFPVTFECAGNGRARLSPRPISQPWLS